jgi:hypothetical protein
MAFEELKRRESRAGRGRRKRGGIFECSERLPKKFLGFIVEYQESSLGPEGFREGAHQEISGAL